MTKLIPLHYRLLALAVLALAVWGWGWVRGASHGEAKLDAYKLSVEKETIIQGQKVAQVRADLLSDAVILEGVKNAEYKVIDGKLAAANADSMRLRAERRAAGTPAPAVCAGATGAELSRPDAAFSLREAARADRLRASLAECAALYNKARDALEKLAK